MLIRMMIMITDRNAGALKSIKMTDILLLEAVLEFGNKSQKGGVK